MTDGCIDVFTEDYDTSDATVESAHEGGGGAIEKDGMYHVMIQSAEHIDARVEGDAESSDRVRQLPYVKLQMKVLAGDHEDQKEKKMYHSIYLAKWKDESGTSHKDEGQMFRQPDKNIVGILAFLHAFGTVGEEVFGQEKVRIKKDMFDRLVATHAVIKVTMSEEQYHKESGKTYKPRPELRFNNDAYAVGHEKVKDVSKDTETINYTKDTFDDV